MTKERQQEIIELIRKEVKPALGCTEPVAVSLAVARSCEALCAAGDRCQRLEVEVSANILKNGMGVGIPGTGMIGLHIASALAAACGKSDYGLEVLKDLDNRSIERAKKMTEAGQIKILLADTPVKLYIRATAVGKSHTAVTVIKDNHDSIVSVELDGKDILHKKSAAFANAPATDITAAAGSVKEDAGATSSADSINSLKEATGGGPSDDNSTGERPDGLPDPKDARENPEMPEKTTLDYKLSVKEILEFAREADVESIAFILDSVKLNKALADEGLRGDYGLKVGKTIADNASKDIFGQSVLTHAMAATAAASDARMAGCTLPAMSNSGSGNQGITVTVPVIAVAEKMGVSDEQLARALVLSHLVAIHIKGYLGKLSALCGCVIASTGSSCGIVYLNGGSYEQICSAIKNMIGNITGMVCDGAKVGCALKVASGVSSSLQAAVLAMKGICISSNDGIIEDDIEKTIANLGRIGSVGMQNTDKMILDIMVEKK